MMARGKKGVARPHPTASGLEDSSTATSPSAPGEIEALPLASSTQQALTGSNQQVHPPARDEAAAQVPTSATQSDHSNPVSSATIKRSFVWEHFKVYDKVVKGKDGEGNDVDIVKKRAYCIHCPRGKIGDFAADSSRNGTSGMIRHINQFCRYYPPNISKSQRVLVGDKSLGNKLTAVAYDQDNYVDACVEMIVMDELPFSFVEKKGFNRFCGRVCPLFKVPSRRKLVRRFLSIYDAQKKELSKIMKEYRVCLTTDTWTSVQNINYMVLTAHFIDVDWKMHKRVINFCVIQNHQGATIGRLIESCLLQWEIEKVLTITVDNASANKSALEWLRSKMNKCSSYKTVLGGKYMHVRCTAHITNLIMAHEVDQYLNAPLEFVEEEEDGFDILCWWKINGPKFPVVAAIARDVLAVQTSTVASESAFSTGGRVIDAFRSSLTPKTVEALICMQNWLLGDDIAQEVEEPTIENTEFYEQAEKDHESTASSRNTRSTIPKAKGKGKAAVVNVD